MNSPIRILIIDEHDAFRQALHTHLEQADSLTVVGEARHTSIEQISALEPDVILLGLNAPCPNDVHIITRINERYPRVKILVLGAGDAQDRLALDVFRQGAQGYLDKDANSMAEIIAAIRTLNRGGAILDPGMAGWILSEIAQMQRQNAAKAKKPGFPNESSQR